VLRSINSIVRYGSTCLVFIAVGAFLSGCEKPVSNSAAQLERDPAAKSELARINALLSSARPVTRLDIESLDRLREKYPDSALVRPLLQSALIRRGDWGAAEKVFTDIPESERTAADKLNLAKIYLKQGRFAEAESLLKMLLTDGADKFDVIAFLGQAQFYGGKLDEAAKNFESVQSELIAKKRTEELTLLGTIYFRRGENDRAIDILTKAIAASPEDLSANNALSRVYAAAGDHAKAETFRAKVESINAVIAAEEKRKSRLIPIYYQLEDAYAAKDYDKVITLVRKMEAESDPATRSTLYQYLAAAYQGLGKDAEAKTAREEAAKFTQK